MDQEREQYECAGCGGALRASDVVLAWWPVHPKWVPGQARMAFIHVGCAAPLQSLEVEPAQPLARIISRL